MRTVLKSLSGRVLIQPLNDGGENTGALSTMNNRLMKVCKNNTCVDVLRRMHKKKHSFGEDRGEVTPHRRERIKGGVSQVLFQMK